MSAASTPSKASRVSAASTPSIGHNDGLNQLTPRSKVQAMLADLDSDPEEDARRSKSPRINPQRIVEKPALSPIASRTGANGGASESEEDAAPRRPAGRIAARLKGSENEEEHGEEDAYAR
ncbi:hypothetical protein LTS18_012743, partial [Coniosporium uncinatum]